MEVKSFGGAHSHLAIPLRLPLTLLGRAPTSRNEKTKQPT